MAYMSQEKKAQIAPAVKPILKRYGLKGSLSVRHHSTLVLTIKEGKIDFVRNWNETGKKNGVVPAVDHLSINPYWCDTHFTGDAKSALKELLQAMNNGNHNRSDLQADHYDVGWYVDIHIGRWDKPYILTE